MYSTVVEKLEVLACTGGIGSGKSYVSRIFGKLGVPVYYSDDRAKQLYDDAAVKEKVCSLFGNDIYDSSGKLRRDRLASLVFSDRNSLAALESVIYPALTEDFRNWLSRVRSDYGFVIFESAVILQKPEFLSMADKIMVVTAPEELRIRRVIMRDGVTREQVVARMSNQASQEKMEAMADFVIFADDCRPLLPQIEKVLDSFSGRHN